MLKKKIALLIATSLLAMTSVASAANKAETFSITPVIGGYLFDGKQHLDANVLFGARIGYNFTDAVGFEALFDYSHNNESTLGPKPGISMYRYGGDMLYHFFPEGKFVPFFAAGYSAMNFDGNNDGISNKGYKQTRGVVDYGAGLKYFISDNVALRGDVRHLIYRYDRTYSNFETTAGVYFAFGGAAPAVKPVESAPAPVPAPIVQPVDSDSDGVPDTLDKCPGTPAGVAVGSDGCPLDTDKDGVPDYLDKCPATPAGVTVDANGCPLDSDRDGVPDYLDKCPATPAGVTVGTDGCPLDSDKDGVPDYLDKCPATPAGVTVDANGCPPEVVVPAHVKAAAAERFCSKPAILAINFDTNKADIKPRYHDELKTVGDFLMYFPNAKGEISGHSDNVGSNVYNQKLSERRAESVKKYISTTFGVDPGRITTKGYGETKPIVTNKTKAGKAKNRRIEANFTCE